MCAHSICPAGREGIYIISKRSYIEWAQPIYRICNSKYIEKHLMKYHQVLFIVPYCESLEELHRSFTGREAGVPYGCQLMLPHSGSASNTFVSPFQGKVMRQEKSFGSLCSSREPYLWSPTRGKPREENWTRI